MTASPPSGYLPLGRLGRSFKLAGGVRFRPVSDAAEQAVCSASELFVSGLGRAKLREAQQVSGVTVLWLEGVRDRSAARALVNAEVWVNPAVLTEEVCAALLEPDEQSALVGLPVRLGGSLVGQVSAALLGGPNDLLEVRLATGAVVLLPLAAPYVTVTAEAIELTDPPAGLLEA